MTFHTDKKILLIGWGEDSCGAMPVACTTGLLMGFCDLIVVIIGAHGAPYKLRVPGSK